MNVPVPPLTLVGEDEDGEDIGITEKIASKTAIGDADMDGTPDGADAALAGITYVIDPRNGNCGAGFVMDGDGNFLDADGNITTAEGEYVPVAVAGGIAADVGAGYSDTLAKFMTAVEADADVKTAQDALDVLLDDETDDDVQTAAITAAREALAEEQAKQVTAHTALYATGAGPINMAGIAEWRAKGAVEAAVGAWNKAVMDLETAGSAIELGNLQYNDKYVQVDSDQLLALFNDDGEVKLANVRNYANANGDNTSTQLDDDGTITGDSAFDAAGNLILPMELWNHDDDATTPEVLRVNPENSATFSTVNTRLNDVNGEVELLQELADDTVAEAVAGLTGDEGQVSMNEQIIGDNSNAIVALEEEVGGDANFEGSRIDHNEARSMQNADDIMTNAGHIAINTESIGMNTASIGMNASSIGVGSYDGESAFAVGFQIQGEMASFKVGVTSAGGETGASAGVGFQF